jgi:1,4-dihydroxy-2-naphthoate octaprenyltransferase
VRGICTISRMEENRMAESKHRNRVFLILKLARLHFLVPGFLLYIFGFLFAVLRGGVSDIGVFLFGYSIFFAAHLSVHFSNDYFDREGDKLGQSNALSGGSGVLAMHTELERFALIAAIVLLLASISLAGVFTLAKAFPFSFFAYSVVGALIGWFYSAPPLRFSEHGLSEGITALATGLMMPGMGYFVAFGSVDLGFLILALPLACFGMFFILTVEMPDVEADIAAGKKNLLTRFGRRSGVLGSLLSTALGSLLLVVIMASGLLGYEALFLAIAALSLMPLAGAASGLFNKLSTRGEVLRQVKINFASLLFFILIVDAILLAVVSLGG